MAKRKGCKRCKWERARLRETLDRYVHDYALSIKQEGDTERTAMALREQLKERDEEIRILRSLLGPKAEEASHG